LVVRRVGVDPEVVALGRAGRIEAPAEDAEAGSVLTDALPDHDEAALRIHGQGGVVLQAGRERVHLEVAAER
jgi:hypothetical protein